MKNFMMKVLGYFGKMVASLAGLLVIIYVYCNYINGLMF